MKGLRLKAGELKGGLEELKGRLTGTATNQVQTKKNRRTGPATNQVQMKGVLRRTGPATNKVQIKIFLRTTGPATNQFKKTFLRTTGPASAKRCEIHNCTKNLSELVTMAGVALPVQ